MLVDTDVAVVFDVDDFAVPLEADLVGLVDDFLDLGEGPARTRRCI